MLDGGEELRWAEVENRLRVLLAEFRAELLADIYTRNLDPLKEEVEKQRDFCAVHSQELTEVKTRVGFLEKALVVVGTLAGSAFVTIVVGLLTDTIKL